ncbi:MAG: dihydrolipoyl dehydrogenase [Peptococcales bacterium]|jgi:dihydrolipoamide dehydrogenase
MENFDVAVLGGGPGGYVAAIKAAQLGMKVIICEQEHFGGVCLNKGCIPTKLLLKSLKIYKDAKNAAKFGIEGIDVRAVKLNMSLVQQRKSQVVEQLVHGVQGLLKGNKVNVVFGSAELINNHLVKVNGQEYKAKNIIIATGSVPVLPPIPGIDGQNVITSNEALDLEELPESMAIIGGGVIGVEFAQFFAEAGVDVSIFEMQPQILPTIDEEVAKILRKELEKKGVKIFVNAKVKQIEACSIVAEANGEAKKFPAQQVLVAVGRKPNLKGVNPELHGLCTERGAIVTDSTMATNLPHIYAIGDVNGKSMLAHTASMEGIVAVNNIAGHYSKMDYNAIPQCIYSFPEISSVGLSESAAREKYKDILVKKFYFRGNGKALIEDQQNGFVKVVAEPKYKQILGVHIVGPQATELIAEAVVAINLEATADELALCIHPHPTVSESMQEAFHAVVDRAIHSL